MRRSRLSHLLLPLLLLSACDSGAPADKGPHYASTALASAVPVYRLAIHPLHNPQKLEQAYRPLTEYLNRHMPEAKFELESSRDYTAYEAKFRAREPELLLPNPWQALQAMKVGYSVMAMAGDAEDFKGIFLVRRDSPIRAPGDLKGKIVSYPAPTALAACMLPQYFLHRQGVNVMRDLDNRYVGSQESSITHVLLGQSDVGVTWPPPWRAYQKAHPEEAAQLKVIWETSPLLNNAVMARNDVPAAVRARLRALLLGLGQTAEGRTILAGMETARFHAVTDDSYQPVREFIQRFEQDVRPVEIGKRAGR